MTEFDVRAWMEARMREAVEWETCVSTHELLFGVPCGPTLSMTDPTKLAYYMTRPKQETFWNTHHGWR